MSLRGKEMGEPKIIEYLLMPDIAKRLGVSTQTVRQWIKKGRFPPPDAIIMYGTKLYLASTVDAFKRQREESDES
jgi:predicted DNA-binding transcriptional regulator AlpA